MLSNCGAGEDLSVPWTARRSNQSILKEISPEYSLKGLMGSWSSNTLATWWRSDSLEKTLMGKDWEQEEKGVTEDEMVGWRHWLNRREFGKTPGDGEGQGSLVCCSPSDRKESDMTEDWTTTNILVWKLPRTEECGGPQPMGSQRIGHDWTCARTHTDTHTADRALC